MQPPLRYLKLALLLLLSYTCSQLLTSRIYSNNKTGDCNRKLSDGHQYIYGAMRKLWTQPADNKPCFIAQMLRQ
jgi:hypothetical protein